MIKDSNQIQIAKIQNLRMIYFYDAEFSSREDENFLGLTINYGQSETLTYDYKSPYYEEFLNKVLSCYKQEGKKALVLGEMSNKIVDSLLTGFNNNNGIKSKLTSKVIFYDSLLDKDILSGYLTDILKCFLQLYLSINDVKIDKVVGFKDKYMVRYDYLSNSFISPIIIYKVEEDVYHFRMTINHLDIEIYDACEGNIRHSEERVYIEWISQNTGVKGTSLYSPEKGYNEAALTHNLKTIALDQMIHNVTDKEKDVLNCYSNLILNNSLDKVVSTVSNQYLLYETTKLNSDSKKKSYVNITLLDDIALLKKKTIIGRFVGSKETFNTILSEKLCSTL